VEEQLLGRKRLEQDTRRIRTLIPQFIPLTQPLTSTSWDGDSYSTTAKTVIDLSAVFSVPAGVRAVLVHTAVRDSAASTNNCYLILSPNGDAGEGMYTNTFAYDDWWSYGSAVVPCDANGDIYYQINASGAGTFDAVIQIWGYWL